MHDDVHFVNSLYGQSNEETPYNMNILLYVIGVGFLILIIWASFSEIDELARGQGKVIPANKIQTIQNLDGGTVSEILIQEGEHILKEQPLMKIDTIRFEASLEENQEMYNSLLAKNIRLKEETAYKVGQQKIESLVFPVQLKGNNYTVLEDKLFKTRIQELENSLKTLRLQLSQKEQELQELYSKEEQLKRSLSLISQQKDAIDKMVKNGSKSNVELLKMEHTYNETKGDLDATTLSIPRSKFAIEESKSKIEEKLSQFKSEASKELQTVEADLKKIEARLVSDNDKLNKTIVRSPVDGIVKLIHINTIGGVVKSGDNLVEIVPDSDILIIETKIDPKDIAFINPTQKAIVKITAYDFSIYGALEGKIVDISADSIEDKASKDNKPYYKVIIKTNKNFLEKDGKILPIIPGMIANVDIITGKKTVMDFLLKPIIKAKRESFHER
jgi:adhesin transport system membrane fusion protein